MKKIINKIVFYIYKKSEKYLLDHGLLCSLEQYDFDFWGFTDD